MSLDEDENIIRANFPSLLLARELKAKTGGAEWRLHEIHHIHSMPRNIEFGLSLVSGSACLRVGAKINRKTYRFSNIEVEEI
jgi:hypothetical protein